MPDRSLGDSAQTRMIIEQAVEATVVKMHGDAPAPKAEIPPMIKAAGAILTALFTMGVSAFCFWMVTTLNQMQITVARIDERQQSQVGDAEGKFRDIDRRITNLESFHRSGIRQ